MDNHSTKVTNFIINLHNFLKDNNNCFLSGSFIFDDSDSKLFNFLTFNKTDTGCLTNVKLSQNSSIHWSFTHESIFKTNKDKIIIPDCLPPGLTSGKEFSKNDYKLEFLLNPSLTFLCDSKSDNDSKEKNPQNKIEKRVILYFPFCYKDDLTKRFLFLKLESAPMDSLTHIKNAAETYIPGVKYLSKKISNKIIGDTKYKTRQEKDIYTEQSSDDKMYYSFLFIYSIDNDIRKWYDSNIRTGNEMFITKPLRDKIFNESKISGGKITKKLHKKSHKKNNKKNNKNRTKSKTP